jgi:TrmH family RNA methyltransferase
MISKSQAKFIKSLQLKKYRKQEQCFVVDGEKGVSEVLRADFSIELLVATESYHKRKSDELSKVNAPVITVSDVQLAQLSSFQTNESVIAVVKQKPNQVPELKKNEYALMLDDIRDPGNLGSIIRSADWFGIRKIFASAQTADFYNPKVINATMGSFTRVEMGYCNLAEQMAKIDAPAYGTFMDGENIHNVSFATRGLIIIGNEANGISPSIQKLVTHRITIPGVKGAESLNAAVATGIVLDNWSRLKK